MNRRGTAASTSVRTKLPACAPHEAADRPAHGDVIISRHPPPDSSFGISQHPGAVHVRVSRRDTAADLACAFAERHGVDVWERRGDSYSPVRSYRPDAARAATTRDVS